MVCLPLWGRALPCTRRFRTLYRLTISSYSACLRDDGADLRLSATQPIQFLQTAFQLPPLSLLRRAKFQISLDLFESCVIFMILQARGGLVLLLWRLQMLETRIWSILSLVLFAGAAD